MALFFGSWSDPVRPVLGAVLPSPTHSAPEPGKPAEKVLSPACHSKLTFLMVNVCGLRAKKHKFHTLIGSYEPDVFVAVETWISEEITESSLFPTGYSIFRRDRNSHGGGVLIDI